MKVSSKLILFISIFSTAILSSCNPALKTTADKASSIVACLNGYSGADCQTLLVTHPWPTITMETDDPTNVDAEFTISSCDKIQQVIVTRSSTVPDGIDPDWQDCNTTVSAITHGFLGVEADYDLFVFVKYIDNTISTRYASFLNVTYDTSAPPIPALTLLNSDPTKDDASFTMTNCTDVDFVMVKEVNVAPLASDSGWQACTTSAGAITHNWSGADGDYDLYVWSKDNAGNVSLAASSFLNITVDTTVPVLNITSPLAGTYHDSSVDLTISYTASDTLALAANPISIYYSIDAGTSWVTLVSNTAYTGTYTWVTPTLDDPDVRIRVTALDTAGNLGSTEHGSNIGLDLDSPYFSVGQFQLNNGDASTVQRTVEVDFQAVDNVSPIDEVCIKYIDIADATPVDPASSDDCWIDISTAPYNYTQSKTLNLSNYRFGIGYITSTYVVFAWVKDRVGHISALTAAGAGTSNRDKDSIVYNADPPPTVYDVYATDDDGDLLPHDPDNDFSFTISDDVYIKWKATDNTALPVGSVSLYYTLDDTSETNWVQIATGLSNSAGAGCTLTDAATGCYKWSAPVSAPTYFKIQVRVADENSQSSQSSTPPLNVSPPLRLWAGSTDTGVGGSSRTTMFISSVDPSGFGDPHSLLIHPNGDIYVRDVFKGILKVDSLTGNTSTLISIDGVGTGDGAVLSASGLKKSGTRIFFDENYNILVWDDTKIRRINLDVTPHTIQTIIGGGADSSTGVTDPLSLQIVITGGENGSSGSIQVLPNGDIYFLTSGNRLRIFDKSANTISTVTLTANYTEGAACDLAANTGRNLTIAYNPSTSAIIQANFGCYVRWVGSVDVDPTSPTAGQFLGELSVDDGQQEAYYYTAGTSLNGDIYYFYRNNAGFIGIYKYNPFPTNTHTMVVGTGYLGSCPDNTHKDSCDVDPQSVFISKDGKIYWIERGLVRTLDNDDNVVTIAGASHSFGDGSEAISARFGNISSFSYWYDSIASEHKVVTLDQEQRVIREITYSGNIEHIAGDGSQGYTAVIGTDARTTSLAWPNSSIHAATTSGGDIIYECIGAKFCKIDRADNNKWQMAMGGGAIPYYNVVALGYGSNADGQIGTDIDMSPSYNAYLMLSHGEDQVFVYHSILSGSWKQAGIKAHDSTDSYRQSHVVGSMDPAVVAPTGSWTCPNGTAMATTGCLIARYTNSVADLMIYDVTDGKYVLRAPNQTSATVVTIAATKETLAYAPPSGTRAFDYYKGGGNEWLFYCNTSGNIVKKNVSDGSTTTYTLPIPGMACQDKVVKYIPSRNSVIFIYEINGMRGIAERDMI